MQLHQYVFVALWLVSTAYAVARGGTPERVIAVAQFLAGPATRFATHWEPPGSHYGSVEIGVFFVDGALFAIVTLVPYSARVSGRSRRPA